MVDYPLAAARGFYSDARRRGGNPRPNAPQIPPGLEDEVLDRLGSVAPFGETIDLSMRLPNARGNAS